LDQIKGHKIEQLAIEGLKKESDLLFFDGPILSHFKDDVGKNYLFYWVDFDDTFNRWLIWKISDKELAYYLAGVSSLYDLLKDKDYVFSVDIDGAVNFSNVQLVDLNWLPDDYLPEQTAYFLMEPEPKYEQLVSDYELDEYVETLRNKAIYFILQPANLKYKSTVPVNEASRFLKSISNSIESFIQFEFSDNYKEKFSTQKSFNKALKEVINELTPRLVDLSFSSFKVGINSDTISGLKQNIQNFGEWRKNLIPKYKHEVVDLDYSDDKAVEEITNKYPEAVREKIYDPIYQYTKNRDFKLFAQEKQTGIKKSLSKVKKENLNKIIPPKKQDIETPAKPKKKFIQGYFEVSEDEEDIRKAPKNELKTGLLFQRETNSAPYEINEISDGKETLQLNRPIKAQITLKDGGTYILEETEEFNAFTVSKDKDEVIQRFMKYLFLVHQRGLEKVKASSGKWKAIHNKVVSKGLND
jgi:hypothetical protein